MSDSHEAYEELIRRARETANLASIGALLSWDQETMMPVRAAAFRAEQLSLVARLAHERATDPRLGELLDRCDADSELTSDPPVAANLREMCRDYARLTLLPSDLVAEISETSSRALEVWKVARRDNDFQAMLPWLATYMGHVHYSDTAYYITGTPELLALAASRRPDPADETRPS